MKEFLGSARNLLCTLSGEEGEAKMVPQCELVLIVSEPTFRFDGGGSFGRVRETETLRLVIGSRGIDRLIESLTETKAELEKLREIYAVVLADEESQ